MSVVAKGPAKLVGRTLASLMESSAAALVGAGYTGKTFPLMVKLIDAAQNLSVQVHPDDALARRMGVGDNGKTECWRVMADGGPIFQGTRPGIDRGTFERALAEGTVADTLNRFESKAGDFFFLEARTVHALGENTLVYEIQQTSNITFRVFDWGRMGLDGKPRPLHIAESLETIDFSRTGFGPRRPAFLPHAGGGEARVLVECPHFRVEERRGEQLTGAADDRCAIVVVIEGTGRLSTAGGQLPIDAMETALVPAAAGAWTLSVSSSGRSLTALVATPRF
ncbi:MAG TPA: type I phosphomannose isomerase catalytic subunit, partial [Polyangia bacterium]